MVAKFLINHIKEALKGLSYAALLLSVYKVKQPRQFIYRFSVHVLMRAEWHPLPFLVVPNYVQQNIFWQGKSNVVALINDLSVVHVTTPCD